MGVPELDDGCDGRCGGRTGGSLCPDPRDARRTCRALDCHERHRPFHFSRGLGGSSTGGDRRAGRPSGDRRHEDPRAGRVMAAAEPARSPPGSLARLQHPQQPAGLARQAVEREDHRAGGGLHAGVLPAAPHPGRRSIGREPRDRDPVVADRFCNRSGLWIACVFAACFRTDDRDRAQSGQRPPGCLRDAVGAERLRRFRRGRCGRVVLSRPAPFPARLDWNHGLPRRTRWARLGLPYLGSGDV